MLKGAKRLLYFVEDAIATVIGCQERPINQAYHRVYRIELIRKSNDLLGFQTDAVYIFGFLMNSF